MNIPNFLDIKFVDANGMLTPEWRSILSSTFTQLQTKAGTEGIFVTPLSATNITTLNTIKSVGSIVYNTTTNKFEACVETSPTTGVFKEIQLSGSSSSFTSLTLDNLIPNTALIADSTQTIISSITTDVELSYVHGVTSDIQTQLNGKQSLINATSINVPNTIVERDSNGRTAVSLNDNNVIPGISVDPQNRSLFDASAIESFNWDAHYGNYLGSTNVSIDYGSGILADIAGHVSEDWSNRQLLDSLGHLTLDWENTSLNNSKGNIDIVAGVDLTTAGIVRLTGYGAFTGFSNIYVTGNSISMTDDAGNTFNMGSSSNGMYAGATDLVFTCENTIRLSSQNPLAIHGVSSGLDTIFFNGDEGNMTLTPTSTIPSNPAEGMMYVNNSVGNHLYIYLNGIWNLII